MEIKRPGSLTWSILFVDDDRLVLDGLRRMLRPMRHQWDMEFCCDAKAAATIVEHGTVDALVTDMRMPVMNGVQLLSAVRDASPGTLRMVLSGYADRDAAVGAVGLAHQFLAKPCEPETLIAVLRRSHDACLRLADPSLVTALVALPALPGRADLARAVQAGAGHGANSLAAVAQAVEADVAMTARILQLVSSSFFGLGYPVASVADAVTSLGSDVLEALSLSPAAMASDVGAAHAAEVLAVSRHCVRVSRLAGRIAALQGCDPTGQAAARMGGMLHEAGRLALLSMDPIHAPASSHSHDSHAAAGAALLALWGLPDTIVDTVAYQCGPWPSPHPGLLPAAAVHFADALVHKLDGEAACGTRLDVDGLSAFGLRAESEHWFEEAIGLLGKMS